MKQMSTRSKWLIIDIILVLVVAGLVIAGAFLVSDIIGDHNQMQLDVGILNEVRTKLSAGVNENPADLNTLANSLPQGYGLAWLDKDNRVLKQQSVSQQTLKLLLTRADLSGAQDIVKSYYGNVYFVKSLANTKVLVVDATGDYYAYIQRALTIYSLIVAGLLIGLFVGVCIWQQTFIFPKLAKLRRAMTEVYNGNYNPIIRLRHMRKVDDISQLLVDFDRLRRRIADATKAKEDADRERGVMISGISHDLRTPLTVIQVHAKGLVDGVAQRMGKTEQYYDNIYSTACSMLSLVDKLAEFSKVETHTVTYSFLERDLGVVLQEYVNNHYIPYAARGLKFKLKLPKGRPLTVNLDKEQFLRVLQNICDNSLKYKDKEVCTMTISAEIRDTEMVLRLSDDGPGIGDFEAEYIFESYYRGDPSRTNPISGSGLGLSIVKNIILAHNGQIQAYNNNGLTIEITLPYRRKK